MSNDSIPGIPEQAPKPELLRVQGWQVAKIHGPYCVAWRGADEIVLRWHNNQWERIAGKGDLRSAG